MTKELIGYHRVMEEGKVLYRPYYHDFTFGTPMSRQKLLMELLKEMKAEEKTVLQQKETG
ncbi:hypothetical protein [Salibacterium qingdaonense]|uniref:Uncharacterized protein n=1 Tax=Salibacterium qingdaonense TaxID=266892 RepID=A0A1I4NXY9_9BACI|nr:hypothetical protein [Salibacterium qingdaonense]SFM20329.1 hypothetical protein SAMN04488054_12138 [Salibacterium qingdaonense]